MLLKPLSTGSGLPFYYQVRESIRQAIASGAIKAHERLPPEAEIAKALQVSLITVRRALRDLEIDGLVVRRQGVGTFASSSPLEQRLDHLSGFSEDMEQLHHASSARVLRIDRIPATEEICAHLGVQLAEEIIRIQRVRYADDEPLMFNLTYLPKAIGEQVAKEDLTVNPIFRVIETKLGIGLAKADYQLEAVIAPQFVARVLGQTGHLAALLVRRTTYSAQGQAIDFTQLYYRGNRFRYVVQVERTKSSALSGTKQRLKLIR